VVKLELTVLSLTQLLDLQECYHIQKTLHSKVNLIADFKRIENVPECLLISFDKPDKSYNMNLNLNGKVALISGAHRGTGEIIARRLAEEGVNVLVHGFDQESSELVAQSIKNAHPVWGDLCTDEGTVQVLQQAQIHHPHIDILVNNYGTATPGKWQNFDSEQWIDIYQKNVLSAARLIAAVLPQMKPLGWGRIIQLGTIGSLNPNKIMPHYYASKGALANMTASLCKEVANTGITINSVSPGLILTEELKTAYQIKAVRKGWGESWPEIEKAIVKHEFPNPVGRMARREEVADLVCYLASDNAGFINGQNIRIDGGALSLSL